MPPDLLDNLDYDGDSIRNIINGMTATLMYTNSNGEEETMELGPIDRIDMSTSSSGYTLSNDDEDDVFSFTGTATGRIADLMEDYIRNRNQDDKIFINHNTCQREIEYNSIDDVIEFREYLDNIIKEHYQGR